MLVAPVVTGPKKFTTAFPLLTVKPLENVLGDVIVCVVFVVT